MKSTVIAFVALIAVGAAGTFAVAGSAPVELVCRAKNGAPMVITARRSEVVELPGRWFVIQHGAGRPTVAQDCEVMP